MADTQPTYLDDSGNPVSAPASTQGQQAQGPVYLDESGNPTQTPQSQATPEEKPGFFKRLGQSVGIPTSKEELAAMAPTPTDLILPPGVEAGVKQIEGYGKTAYQGAKEGAQDVREALTNIAEGQPIRDNIGKAVSGVLHQQLSATPFIGPAIETAGQDILEKNYLGAAGGLTGVIGQIVAPELHEKLGRAFTFTSDAKALTTAVAQHEAASTLYDQRLSEHNNAVDSAVQASKVVDKAKADLQAGNITREQYNDINSAASKTASSLRKATQALSEANESRSVASAEVDRMTRKMIRTKGALSQKQSQAIAGAKEDFMQAIPPARRGAAAYTDEDYQIGRRYLENHHANTQELTSTQDVYDALDNIERDMNSQVQPYVKKYANEPINTDVRMDVRDRLADSLGGKTRADFVGKAMRSLDSYNLIDPSIEEADSIRQQLNSEVRDNLKRNFRDVQTALDVDPDFAAKYYALESLRNGIYGALEDRGIANAREIRQDQSSIIRLRNAAEDQIKRGEVKVRGSGESGPWRKAAATGIRRGSVVAGAGLGAGAGTVLGFPGEAVGAAAGAELGGIAGERLGRAINPGDLTRNDLVKRSFKVKGGGVPSTEVQGPGTVPQQLRPPEAVSPRMQMYTPQRELTPLHSDLATHYGEDMNQNSYVDLEQRFKDDIADKRRHNVPLESDEKTLLGKINQADAADRLAAQKQWQEMAAKGQKLPSATLPEEVEPLLQIPESKIEGDMNTYRGIQHDLAHAIVGTEMGLEFPDGIRSHLHPENKTEGSLMSAPINYEPFLDEDGNVDLNKVRARIADIATTYVAGGVANDLYHNIPFTENQYLGADIDSLRKLMKSAGFSEAETSKHVAMAAEQAAAILSQPNVQDIIERHASVREAGLDEKYHISPERMNQILEDVKGAIHETGTSGKSTAVAGRRHETGEGVGAGTEAEVQAGATAGVRKTGQGPAARENEGAEAGGRAGAAESGIKSPKLGKTEEPTIEHEEVGRQGGIVRLKSPTGEEVGRVRYTIPQEERPAEAAVTAAHIEPGYRNQGYAQRMYERAADELRAKGIPAMTSDLKGTTTQDAAKVWDRLSEKYPGQIEKFASKPGSPGYRWNLEQKPEIPSPKLSPVEEAAKRGLRERTVGTPEHDQAIREGGGVPGGIFGHAEEPTHVKMFHDPMTGTTLGFGPGENVTPGATAAKIQESRAKFAVPQVAAHERNSGSTFTPEGKNLAGQDLYAVGSYPERTVQLDNLTPEALAKFKTDNRDVLSQPGHAVGTWKDPDTGKAVLDISKTFKDRGEAVAAGKAANQKAIYHLGTGTEIPTGGTGEFIPSPKLGAISPNSISGRLKETYGTTDDPLKAGFILSDGSMVPLKGEHNTMLEHLYNKYGDLGMNEAERTAFINNENAVRTRFRTGKGGEEIVFSVPKTGVNPAQMEQIKKSVAAMGRNGNALIEISEGDGASTRKEFVRPSDIEPMLREIGAHPESQQLPNPKLGPRGSTVPLMKNPLEIKGTGEQGKVNTLDVAQALNEFTKNKIGSLEPGKQPAEQVERAKKLAEDEAKYQLNQANSGKAWYTDDIGVHDQILSGMRPELNDRNMVNAVVGGKSVQIPAKLGIFKANEAIMSSGQKPYQNLKTGIKGWDYYNETGEFSPVNPDNKKSWGPRSADSYGYAIQSLNNLIKEKGEAGAVKWLLEDHPIKEIRQYQITPTQVLRGKATDMVPGSMLLGPKRGPFFLNLNGIEAPFTADIWVSRTWNRWMGTIEHDPDTGEITPDSPRTDAERKLMQQSFAETANKLGLSTSSLQAALWFYEQKLYEAHGVPKESWTFSDAAKRVRDEAQEAQTAHDQEMEQGNLFTEKPRERTAADDWLEAMRSMRGSK